LATRMLTVSRAVVEVNAKFHPRGGRFLVKDYPKDRKYRRIKLTSRIVSKLQATAVSWVWPTTICSSPCHLHCRC
jgi:hypothetical protein